MATIFDFQHTHTSDSIPTGLFVLPDPENMGVAIGSMFIASVELKIYCVL